MGRSSLLRRFIALSGLVAFSIAPAMAAEPTPGSACTGAGNYTVSGGPELSGVGHLMVCSGSVWNSVLDFDATANSVLPYGLGLSGDISPAQITANQNDYNPAGLSTASVLRLNSDASRNITSLAGGADGRVITLMNIGSFPVVLKNDDGTTGTAANRFALTGDLTLAANQSAMLMYDSTAFRWRQIANGSASGGGAPTIAIDDLTDAIAGTNDNMFFGSGVGSNYTGSWNTGAGINAMNGTTGADANTAYGSYALNSNTGGDNTAVGQGAMEKNTSGGGNTALGRQALWANTTGTLNTAVGTFALIGSVTGDNNVSIGENSLFTANGASSNTAIGTGSMYYTTTGGFNVAVGQDSMLHNTDGYNNVAVGFESLNGNNSGHNNTVLGYQVGSNNFNGGNSNILIGTSNAVTLPTPTSSNYLNIGNAITGDLSTGYVNLNGGFGLTSDISPAQITANQNDYSPAVLSTASVLRLNTNASRNITSLAGGADGRIITIMNIGSFPIVLKNDDGATGTAANRFALTGDLTLAAKQSAILMYDSTALRWRQVANGTATGAGDNLGNHTATTNIQLGSNWLSGDGGSEGIAVNSIGNVGIGTPPYGAAGQLLVLGGADVGTAAYIYNGSSTAARYPGLGIYNYTGGFGGTPSLTFYSGRGNMMTTAALQSGDAIGEISFMGVYNTANGQGDAAYIQSQSEGTFSSNNYPANLIFYTNPGAAASVERLRISANGMVDIKAATALSGRINSALLGSSQDNYAPTGLAGASVIRLQASTAISITGLTGGADGRVLTLLNVGSNTITLSNQSASSTAANRFAFGTDISIAADQSVAIIYDSTSQRWRAAGLPFDTAVGGGGIGGCEHGIWISRDSARQWDTIVSSSDGSKLAATVYGGQIYTSTDSGVTWTAQTTTRDWEALASSADGSKLVAAVYSGQIYTSTDSGVTWTAQASGTHSWGSIASSADGTKLAATVYGGQIYTSTDSGVNWTARATNRNWRGIASSADGVKLAAVVDSGQIYTSTDSGVNWTARDSARVWYSVASSSDGTKLAAVVNGGQIYTSTDSGVTWTAQASGTHSWGSIASSADGVKLAAVANGDQLFLSDDSGVTWTAREAERAWASVASSADGATLAVAEEGGKIYTSVCAP